MKYFKIISLTFLIFCTFFIPSKIFAGSTHFLAGYTTQPWPYYLEGNAVLDKNVYLPGEPIIATVSDIVMELEGWEDDIAGVKVNDICIFDYNDPECTPLQYPWTFYAPSTPGTYNNIVFDARVQKENVWTLNSDVSVTVPYTVVLPPEIIVSANPTTISPGESSTITWQSQNATTCTSGGNGTGTYGSFVVTPNSSTNYQISCTSNGITRYKEIRVNVIAPPYVNVWGFPNPVLAPGDTSTIRWTSTMADSCSSNTGQGGTGITGGPFLTPPINSPTTYTVQCTRNAQNIPGSCSGSYIVKLGGCVGYVVNATPDTYEGESCGIFPTPFDCMQGMLTHGCYWDNITNLTNVSCSGLSQFSCNSHYQCTWTDESIISQAVATFLEIKSC